MPSEFTLPWCLGPCQCLRTDTARFYFFDFGPGRIVALIFFAAAISASLHIRHSIPPTLMRFGSGITSSASQRSKEFFEMPINFAACAVEWLCSIADICIPEIRCGVKVFFRRATVFPMPGMIQDFEIPKIGIPSVRVFGVRRWRDFRAHSAFQSVFSSSFVPVGGGSTWSD